MIFFQLLWTAGTFGVDLLLQSRYGGPALLTLTLLALVLLGIGTRAQSKPCLSVSAAIFLFLMTQA